MFLTSAVDQGRQAMRADPQTPPGRAAGEQYCIFLGRAAAKATLRHNRRRPAGLMLLRCGIIESNGLLSLDRQGTSRADCQAEAGAIAERIADHVRLAVQDLDCPFSARRNAQAASVAQFLVDTYDVAQDHFAEPPRYVVGASVGQHRVGYLAP